MGPCFWMKNNLGVIALNLLGITKGPFAIAKDSFVYLLQNYINL
jgi:hypothetical protein